MAGDRSPGPATRRTRARSFRFQLVMLMLGAALLVATLVAIDALTVSSVLHEIEEDTKHTAVQRATSLLAIRARAKAAVVEEYGFWDDTYRFMANPRAPGADEFIRMNFVEWLPAHYGDEAIALYGPDRSPVFAWTHDGGPMPPELVAAPLLDTIARRKVASGLIRTGRGLMLVAGALIQRTEPSERTTPNGFLVLAQPVTDSLLRVLSEEMHERIHLRPLARAAAVPRPPFAVRTADSTVVTFTLPDVLGAPVVEARVTYSRVLLHQLAGWALMVRLLVLALGLLVILALWRGAHRALIAPARRTAAALEAMQRNRRLGLLPEVHDNREWELLVSAFNDAVHALRVSEDQYRVLFEVAPDALFLLHAGDGTIVDANPAAERLLARPREELVGRTLDSCWTREPDPQGRPDTVRLREPGGTVRTVSVASTELAFGEDRRVLFCARDLSERETLELQLRQAQKMEAVGLLAGGIAHDFNNLVGAALMNASLIEQSGALSPDDQESLREITSVLQRAADLTRQLLAFSRGKPARLEPVQVNDVVGNIVRLCSRTFDRSIRIEMRLADDLPLIVGDAGQLEQALLNVAINARDAIVGGGRITISTSTRMIDGIDAPPAQDIAPGEYVAITVTDTGCGIPPEALAHLFEPFFTTKEPGKGTGLGLPTAYATLRAHGGAIHVGCPPDGGTRVELLLPRPTDGVSLPPIPGAVTPTAGRETILLVDDEQALRGACRRMLERLGYAVIEAENGQVAVDYIEHAGQAVDLVILDMMMPVMGGAEAFARIRALRHDLPVLICSGYASGDAMERLVADGADGLLRKPFDADTLGRTVRAVLEHATHGARVA